VDLVSDYVFVGPFDLVDTVWKKLQLVRLTQWSRSGDACTGRGIAPPSLDTHMHQRGKVDAENHITKNRAVRTQQQHRTEMEEANAKQARKEELQIAS
jgi:hypothetical protein